MFDNAPFGKSFGDVISSPLDIVYRPGDTVRTSFVGANPRNNLRLESTFAAIERQNSETGSWEAVRTDSDWNLLFHWKRTNTILGISEVSIEWQIEDDYYNIGSSKPLESGTYRMRYCGVSRIVLGNIQEFEGI